MCDFSNEKGNDGDAGKGRVLCDPRFPLWARTAHRPSNETPVQPCKPCSRCRGRPAFSGGTHGGIYSRGKTPHPRELTVSAGTQGTSPTSQQDADGRGRRGETWRKRAARMGSEEAPQGTARWTASPRGWGLTVRPPALPQDTGGPPGDGAARHRPRPASGARPTRLPEGDCIQVSPGTTVLAGHRRVPLTGHLAAVVSVPWGRCALGTVLAGHPCSPHWGPRKPWGVGRKRVGV